jgi:allatostatin A receptor
VVYPVSRIRSERNTVFSIFFLWLITFTTNIPVIVVHGTVSAGKNSNSSENLISYCTFNEDEEKRVLYYMTFFATSYILPLIFISILYFLMLLRLWKSNISQSLESKRGKKRITRLVLIIVATFAAFWFPIQIILLLKSKGMYAITHLTVALQIVAHILAYASSCVNPLLYAFLSENFRKSFRKVFKNRLCKVVMCLFLLLSLSDNFLASIKTIISSSPNKSNSNFSNQHKLISNIRF